MTNETTPQLQPFTPPTSASDLLARYAAGERDFHGAYLRGAYLTGAYLTGAYLMGADLMGADLTGAYLRGADLTGADLRGAYLTGAYLMGADLTGADLMGADLMGADLTGADLRGAYLTGADLMGADLRGADLMGADLTGADLRGADLTGVKTPPVQSHDFIAEVLRQAAGDDIERRKVAGVILVSRDWCWQDFARLAREQESAETRAWVVATLSHWSEMLTLLKRYGVADG